ncbi:hypothetical protein [Pseudomonas sp. B392_1p]|jgi:hypothetical protein|uniref:hypothetical protein n=1 Tax=Pseudomonas sp. B392_1p TaxID=3457507 RepID=UPI003FD58CAF
MKQQLLVIALASVALAGCAPANISSVQWDTGIGANAQTRCAEVDMRSKKEMDKVFAQFDGWKLAYMSEYTTANRFGTSGVACFERAQ